MLSLMLINGQTGLGHRYWECCMWTHKPFGSHHSIDQTTKPSWSGMPLSGPGALGEHHQGGRQGSSAHLGHILAGHQCATSYLSAWQKDEQGALVQSKHASCITQAWLCQLQTPNARAIQSSEL